jgi:two-component system response regulator HydG
MKSANIELGKEVEKFDEDVMEIFENYTWPGNLRELRNVVRRSVLMAQNGTVTLLQIPEALKQDAELDRQVAHFENDSLVNISTDNLKQLREQQERVMIEQVLFKTKYNKSKAAAILNIDRTTLYNKIAKYKIES